MKKTKITWILCSLLTASIVGTAFDRQPILTNGQLALASLVEHAPDPCDDDYTAIDTRFIFPDKKIK